MCPCKARNRCWFHHDEDRVGGARAATACAATSLPPASLLVRLSSLLEQIADVLHVFPLELLQQRIVVPIVDVPVLAADLVRVWEEIEDHIVAVPVPQIAEDIVEQVVDVPVPQILE